jgi:hypothetical protein
MMMVRIKRSVSMPESGGWVPRCLRSRCVCSSPASRAALGRLGGCRICRACGSQKWRKGSHVKGDPMSAEQWRVSRASQVGVRWLRRRWTGRIDSSLVQTTLDL